MSPSQAALLFWISVTVCAIAELAVVAATVRASRRSVASDAPGTLDIPHVDGAPALPRPRRWLELIYVAAPAIALVLLFVFTWRAMQ